MFSALVIPNEKIYHHPLNVRLHHYQENKLNEMIKNETYCRKKGLYSKASNLRTGLNNIINRLRNDLTLGTQ